MSASKNAVNKELIRNFGIIAHIDAGKTTTTERLLYYTGREHRMGNVDAGTTRTDFDAEEQDRGITIYSAAVTTSWKRRGNDYQLNIIDTPGHVDFTAEVERSLRVLDGAVVVFSAVEGVEAQSETVWRQADQHGVPRLAFINKMDRVGADFFRVVGEMRKRLGAEPAPIALPCGAEHDFNGIIDLVRMRRVTWDEESQGREFTVSDIPEELRPRAEEARELLCEQLSDVSDEFAERFLDGTLSDDLMIDALRKATLSRRLVPVLTGASLRFQGVQPLIDAVCDLLPSPLDVPPPRGTRPKSGEPVDAPPCKDDAPLVMLAFKTIFTRHNDLTFVRVYSGTLKSRGTYLNPRTGKKERALRVGRVYADDFKAVDAMGAGDIGAVVAFRDVATGDTLCEPAHALSLEPVEFPEPVISVAIEPRSAADREKLDVALSKLARSDPTFRTALNDETGQLVVSGMGELHIEVLLSRVKRDFKLDVRQGKPSVSYREAISAAAEGEATFERSSQTRNLFARVTLRVEPNPQREAPEVESAIERGALPPAFLQAALTGIRGALAGGGRCGFPLIHARATLISGVAHQTESNEVAFEAAGSMALSRAVESAGTHMLEPLMRFEVRAPGEYFGAVHHDLSARRATVSAQESQAGISIISGLVPIAEMFGYSTRLRSLTAGRGSFSLEAHSFGRVPHEVEQRYLF